MGQGNHGIPEGLGFGMDLKPSSTPAMVWDTSLYPRLFQAPLFHHCVGLGVIGSIFGWSRGVLVFVKPSGKVRRESSWGFGTRDVVAGRAELAGGFAGMMASN